MATVELEIPPRSAYVGVVRLVVSSLGRTAGIAEDRLDDLKIAVSEACANAVLSTEEADTDAPVTVSWTEDEDRVTIEIADRGDVYEITEQGDALDTAGYSSRLSMSVALLKSLVGDIEMVPRDGGGMVARFSVERTS